MITDNYDDEFYDFTIRTETASANTVAKMLIDKYHPTSIIDIGCGCGIYLKAFLDLGLTDIIGYDGAECAIKKSRVPLEYIHQFDLRKAFPYSRKYDLAMCVEVAEHIEKEFADNLVTIITQSSNKIIFTAAPPGQAGVLHINLQPKEYWIEKFKNNGFRYLETESKLMAEEMNSNDVIWWIWKNIMLFERI